jgi:hypothetical protein
MRRRAGPSLPLLVVRSIGYPVVRLRTAIGREMVEQERHSTQNGGNQHDEEARKAAGIAVIDLFADLFTRSS